MDEKAGAAARGRGLAGVTTRRADKGVVWVVVYNIEKFGGGSGGFNPRLT